MTKKTMSDTSKDLLISELTQKNNALLCELARQNAILKAMNGGTQKIAMEAWESPHDYYKARQLLAETLLTMLNL